jgi:aminopeptidase
MPDKYNVNGTVVSTKPLFYNGKEINNFKLTFVNGKVETFSAEVGQDTLEKLLNTDEGSRYIGEVALVAYKTPISQSGVLFYETLFDENASCHLALGASYPMNIKAPKTATREQLDKLGSNNSLVHVDFMFGSKDMNVVGYTYENQPIQIFKDGEFVI